MSKHVDVNPILEGLADRQFPRGVIIACALAIVAGLGGFTYGLFADPAWAWGAFLVGLVYTLGIAGGALVFSVILTLTWGRWGRPLKRIAEAAALYLPVGWVLLVVFLLLGNGIYPWHDGTMLTQVAVEPHSEWAITSKPIWLSLPFFIARQLIGVGLITLLGFLYVRASLRPDLIQAQTFMRQKHPDWEAPGWWSLFARAPAPIDQEVARNQKTQSLLGPILGGLYAVIFSFIAFDLIMSLSPWWYANMFGAWFFASCFWLALAFMGVYGLLARDWLGIRHLLDSKVTHDLGKLTFAFCMFWAYTFFAQLLAIWYANMPEETDFLLVRLQLDQWSWLARTVGVLCFLTPFTVLLSRGIKKMKWPFIGILSIIMIGLFLERTLLVMPSVFTDPNAAFPVVLFLAVSIPVGAGFLALLVLVTTWVMSSVPPVPVSDPRLHPHPWDVHVHPIPKRRAEHRPAK